MCFKKNIANNLMHILLAITATENFTVKIGNSTVVENIFPAKISHDL